MSQENQDSFPEVTIENTGQVYKEILSSISNLKIIEPKQIKEETHIYPSGGNHLEQKWITVQPVTQSEYQNEFAEFRDRLPDFLEKITRISPVGLTNGREVFIVAMQGEVINYKDVAITIDLPNMGDNTQLSIKESLQTVKEDINTLAENDTAFIIDKINEVENLARVRIQKDLVFEENPDQRDGTMRYGIDRYCLQSYPVATTDSHYVFEQVYFFDQERLESIRTNYAKNASIENMELLCPECGTQTISISASNLCKCTSCNETWIVALDESIPLEESIEDFISGLWAKKAEPYAELHTFSYEHKKLTALEPDVSLHKYENFYLNPYYISISTFQELIPVTKHGEVKTNDVYPEDCHKCFRCHNSGSTAVETIYTDRNENIKTELIGLCENCLEHIKEQVHNYEVEINKHIIANEI